MKQGDKMFQKKPLGLLKNLKLFIQQLQNKA